MVTPYLRFPYLRTWWFEKRTIARIESVLAMRASCLPSAHFIAELSLVAGKTVLGFRHVCDRSYCALCTYPHSAKIAHINIFGLLWGEWVGITWGRRGGGWGGGGWRCACARVGGQGACVSHGR